MHQNMHTDMKSMDWMRKAKAEYYVQKQINARRIDDAVARSEGSSDVVKSNRRNRKNNGNIKEIVELYTDSQIFLGWIVGAMPKESKTRKIVDRIQSNTKASQWQYCKTSQNPADRLTREQKTEEFGTDPIG
jgi:hypothetical protein